MTVRHSLLAILAVGLLGVSCGNSPSGVGGSAQVSEIISFQFTTQGLTGLRIEGLNGDITVEGSDATQAVTVSGRKYVRSESEADAQANLENIDFAVGQIGSVATITTEIPADPEGREDAIDYVVRMPDSFLIQIANTNGDVGVESVRSGVSVTNTNGTVTFESVTGNAAAVTTNGDITGDVSPSAGGVINLQTTNGDIALAIPDSTSGTLSATTSNGTVTLTGLDASNVTTSATSAVGTIGGGDGTITLTITNGSISLSGF